MSNKIEEKKTYDPTEKVERMNRIFDQLVLPIIVFTIVMAVISAVIIKPTSCVESFADDLAPVEDNINSSPDPYLMREVLLEDMEGNRSIFENGGYIMAETEQSGLVACFQLNESTQFFDNIADSSGSRYSAIVYEVDGIAVTVRIYSETIILVEASDSTQTVSAVFRNDDFTQWTSASDAEANDVLSVISAQQLSELVEQYKIKILSLVTSN